MKAKIRKTQEIVDIISYTGSAIRSEILDRVSYIDSNGVEHPNEKLNFYWDFEVIPQPNPQVTGIVDMLQKTQDVNWESVRIDAAIAAMQSLCENCHERVIRDIQNQTDTERSNVISFLSVRIADALVDELKK